ncbi:MAG: acyltransferase [Proteobacteria bacterium]|nr:acyltransferase [Pseudomonadota bacterium]
MYPTAKRMEAISPKSPVLPITNQPYRFFGSFRCLLAIFVLVSHASGFLGNTIASLSLGNVGVFLFFVVSGTVICEALDIFYRGSTRRFLINRCLKIYPAFWAATIVSYAVYAVTQPTLARFDPWAMLVNASLLLSYLPAGNGLLIISVAWAVIVECTFYMIAAGTFFIARRTLVAGRVLYLFGVAALAFYLFVDATGGDTRFYGAFRFAPYFVLGSAIYFYFTRRNLFALLLAATALTLSVHSYLIYVGRISTSDLFGPNIATIDNAVIASTSLYLAGVALFSWLISARFSPRTVQIDKRLGDITYAVYLIHPAVISIAIYLKYSNQMAFLFAFTISLLVAVLIHSAVERPLMRLRNFFRGRRL